MDLPESEKYFLECFNKTINVEGDVIADPEEISMYGRICKLEGEIEMLEKFYDLRSTTGIQTTILEKKKQLEELYKNG